MNVRARVRTFVIGFPSGSVATELGTGAAQRLLDVLGGKPAGRPRKVVLPTTLVVRDSCGAPLAARAAAVSNRPGPLESDDEPNAIEEREFVTLSQEEGR